MKKGREYVSRGAPKAPERLWTAADEAEEAPPRLSSGLPPSLLPRDYGMAGRVGAYEVRRLARALPETLRHLEAIPENFPLATVEAALDRLLPPLERENVRAESLVRGRLTLLLAHRADRFLYSRTLVPRLRTALEPALGRLSITLSVAPQGR